MTGGWTHRGRKRPIAFALTVTSAVATLLCGALVGIGVSPAPAATRTTNHAPTPLTAWVTAGASVTYPGRAVTPVALTARVVEPRLAVGNLPSALVFAPGDRNLLVVTQGDDRLHEVNPMTGALLHAVRVGIEPDAVAVAPGGPGGKGVALVANLDSNSVTPVDLATWKAGPAIAVGARPVAIAVASGAGGPIAFVADFGSDDVTPISLRTMQPGAPIPAGPGPEALAVVGSTLLVGDFSNSSLSRIDATTLAPAPGLSLPLNPTGIAIAPGGSTAYISGGDGVVPVALGPFSAGQVVDVHGAAQAVALTPNGATAWVAVQSGDIVPVTLATGRVGRAIHLGGHPSALVIGRT